ncbi:hypothetical protein THAOC_21983, partial [Thalassiosira oceanica]
DYREDEDGPEEDAAVPADPEKGQRLELILEVTTAADEEIDGWPTKETKIA